MRHILAVALITLNGCVSLGYHQQKLRETKKEQRDFCRELAKEVKSEDLTIREMLYILR